MESSLIVMSGLPGSGKSILAEAIAKELDIPVFSLDTIKALLLKTNLIQNYEDGRPAWAVAAGLIEEQLKLEVSVIVDAVNAEEAAKDTWRKLAKKYNLELKIIECFNSDSQLHRERIKNRVKNLHGIPEVTWKWVEDRQKVYTDWTESVLRVDMSGELGNATESVVKYVQVKA